MSTYRVQTINGRGITVTDSGIWGDTRFDPDDSAPVYIGQHVDMGIATTNQEWKVQKFTYSGSAVTRIQLAYGSWDDRASLF